MVKVLRALLVFLFSTQYCSADTTYYENGKIQSIYSYNHSLTEYYMNGSLKRYVQFDKFLRKGKETNYDSLGLITSHGKVIFNGRKHGVWKTYQNGQLTDKNRYKFGFNKKYKRTPSGKRMQLFLTYGYASWRGPCDSAQNKFKVCFVPVAGCVVTRKLLFRSSFHNFFVNVRLTARFGINWEDKIYECCSCSRSAPN